MRFGKIDQITRYTPGLQLNSSTDQHRPNKYVNLFYCVSESLHQTKSNKLKSTSSAALLS